MADNDNGQDFASVLVTHDKGKVNAELSKALTEAVQGVRDTGKPATVTLKLKVSQIKDLGEALRVDMGVTRTVPKESSRSIWYPDDASKLHRNDPRQLDMFGDGDTAVVRHTTSTDAKDSQ